MDVFISYARSSRRSEALAIYEELGGAPARLAFLDTEDIEHGEQFPARLVDALFGARVIVILADAQYFRRWYCLFELHAALSPFTMASDASERDPLHHVVVALPPGGLDTADAWRFPPGLQITNSPLAEDPEAVADLVRARLAEDPPTLAERIDRVDSAGRVRRALTAAPLLPPPEPAPPDTPLVPAAGPAPSLGDGFIGRADDLWRIHEALVRMGYGASPVVSLEGGAGVGKSRLAIEYLHRFGPERHPGGWFWIDARTRPSDDAGRPPHGDGRPHRASPLESQWYEILRALDPQVPSLDELSQEAGRLERALIDAFRAVDPTAPAIVVVDNIPEPTAGAPPKSIHEYFPAAGLVQTLLTSRHLLSLASGGSIRAVPIGVLDRADASALLVRRVPSQSFDEIDAHQVADWVGCLPLALELLNAALVAHAVSIDDLVERARSTDSTAILDEAMESLRTLIPPRTLRGASEALTVSFEALPEDARTAVQLLSWFAPIDIPWDLIEAFDPEMVGGKVRAELVARSFVTGSGRSGSFGSVHAVLAGFLRSRVPDPEAQLVEASRAVLGVITPERTRSPASWDSVTACEPHAHELMGHLSGHVPLRQWLVAVGLALFMASMERTRFAEAASIGLETLVLTADEDGRVQADDIPELGILISRLPSALAGDGDLDNAIVWQRLIIETIETDSAIWAAASDNLGDFLRRRGTDEDLREAEAIYALTVPFWRDREPGSMDTATALNNLALIYLSRDRPDDAVPLLEEALDIATGIDGAEVEAIQGTITLARALDAEHPDRARRLLETALGLCEKHQLPDTHAVVPGLLRELASRAYTGEDYGRAVDMLERAAQAAAEVRGLTDAFVTTLAWELYASQLHAERDEEAVETLETYLGWLRDVNPEEIDASQSRIQVMLDEADAW